MIMSLRELIHSLLQNQFQPAVVFGFTQYDEEGYPVEDNEDWDEEDDEMYDDGMDDDDFEDDDETEWE